MDELILSVMMLEFTPNNINISNRENKFRYNNKRFNF